MQRGAACTGLWWPRCASFEAAAATAAGGRAGGDGVGWGEGGGGGGERMI